MTGAVTDPTGHGHLPSTGGHARGEAIVGVVECSGFVPTKLWSVEPLVDYGFGNFRTAEGKTAFAAATSRVGNQRRRVRGRRCSAA